MKKINASLLSILFCCMSIAQAPAIPAEVVSAFQHQFSHARLLSWTSGKGLYAARFRDQGKTGFAYFKPDGQWAGTEKKIGRSKLPATVRRAFDQGDFKAWYIEEVRYIDGPDSPQYVMQVNNSSTLDADHAAAFGQEFLLFYDADGHFLRKEQKEDSIR
jgi:hypothetical protein